MDPVLVDDPKTDLLKKLVKESLNLMDSKLSMHDFRIVSGPTHTNVFVCVIVPFDSKLNAADINKCITNYLKEKVTW